MITQKLLSHRWGETVWRSMDKDIGFPIGSNRYNLQMENHHEPPLNVPSVASSYFQDPNLIANKCRISLRDPIDYSFHTVCDLIVCGECRWSSSNHNMLRLLCCFFCDISRMKPPGAKSSDLTTHCPIHKNCIHSGCAGEGRERKNGGRRGEGLALTGRLCGKG